MMAFYYVLVAGKGIGGQKGGCPWVGYQGRRETEGRGERKRAVARGVGLLPKAGLSSARRAENGLAQRGGTERERSVE